MFVFPPWIRWSAPGPFLISLPPTTGLLPLTVAFILLIISLTDTVLIDTYKNFNNFTINLWPYSCSCLHFLIDPSVSLLTCSSTCFEFWTLSQEPVSNGRSELPPGSLYFRSDFCIPCLAVSCAQFQGASCWGQRQLPFAPIKFYLFLLWRCGGVCCP